MSPAPADPPPDPYYKKTLELKFRDKTLRFDVAHDLFSTFQIDAGSLLLLKTLSLPTRGRVLDVCCGYGTLGLSIAATCPEARVELVDRDLLAIKYCQRNAHRNKLGNAVVYGSVGYEAVPGGNFSLIVCNMPGKAGDAAIEDLIRGARARLAPGGAFYFVVISALNRLMVEFQRKGNLPLRDLAKRNRYVVYSLTAERESSR